MNADAFIYNIGGVEDTRKRGKTYEKENCNTHVSGYDGTVYDRMR